MGRQQLVAYSGGEFSDLLRGDDSPLKVGLSFLQYIFNAQAHHPPSAPTRAGRFWPPVYTSRACFREPAWRDNPRGYRLAGRSAPPPRATTKRRLRTRPPRAETARPRRSRADSGRALWTGRATRAAPAWRRDCITTRRPRF